MWPFKKREEQRAITEWPWDTGGPVPGVNIGVDRALSLVPVFGAARLLADTVASLTPVLYTLGKDGIQRQLPTPSLFTQPSVYGTLFDWLHRGTTSMALQGDAIGLVTDRDYYGFPTMIEWLNPEQVATHDGNLSGPGSYMNPQWWWNGRRINDPRRDLVHIPWFCMPYKTRGLSPIGAFRVTANVGLGAQEYAADWFNNGGVPPGTIQNKMHTVSKEESDIITQRITQKLRTRKPLVFGNDWEYTPIAIKPNEAQFIETARLTATQIAVIYGIPPEKIGGSTGSTLTYNTVESNTLDYLVFSARPWLVRWEHALNRLFPRGQFVKFETSEMLRVDAKTRAQIDQISLNKQAYKTVDEVRADRDLPPMPKVEQSQVDPAINGQPQLNGNGQQGLEVKSTPRSGADAIVYLRSRIKDDSSPILKPPPEANGTKPLAVGRN
jgi:HK97 family phage portal protein